MSHIFISYSRKDLEFAKQIVQALKEDSLDVWIDWMSIWKAEEWEPAIRRGIEEADAFLFLISPDSVASKPCDDEITIALENHKLIVPVVVRDTERKLIREELSKLNWIFCRYEIVEKEIVTIEDFSAAIAQIREPINTDYEWLQYQTKLQVRALDWERHKDNSKLLRGKDLQEAEQKLAGTSSLKEPQPTDLQRLFVLESRNAEKSRQKTITRVTVGVSTVICLFCMIAAVGGGVAYVQSNARATAEANRIAEATLRAKAEGEAETQALISQAGKLDNEAERLRDEDPIISFLLSVEAYRIEDNYQTRNTLFENARAFPNLKLFIDSIGNGLAFSPDGKMLADGYLESIVFYDTITWQAISTLTYQSEGFRVERLAFSPDGKMLAAGSNDGTIVFWNVTSGQVLYTLAIETEGENNLRLIDFIFDSRGHVLALSSQDGTINVWKVGTEKPKLSFSRKNMIGDRIALSPDGTMLATRDESGYMSLWDTTTGKRIGQPLVGPGWWPNVVFSPDGQTLILGDRSGNITFWDVAMGQSIRTLVGDGSGIKNLAISPDGKTLAYNKGRIFIWDIVTAEPRDTFTRGEKALGSEEILVFSPDGRTLASDHGRFIIIWDMVADKSIVKTLEGHEATVKNVDFGLHDDALVSISVDGTAITWDVFTGQILSTQPGQQPYENYGFGEHGDILVTQPGGGTIALWDMTTDKMIGQPLEGHAAYIETVVFSPDEKTLATGSDDKTIILWDIYSGQKLLRLTGHTGSVFGLAFSSDGKKLASASGDGTVRIWNIDPESWMNQVCFRAGRNLQMPQDTSNFGVEDWENYVRSDEWTKYFPGEDYRITCPQWPAKNYSQ